MQNFDQLKTAFINANVDEKINLYISAEGLTQNEYKELLRLFPLNELERLEAALR